MAVAHDAHSESHTGSVGSISEASFSWSHAGAASGVDGVLVFVVGLVTAGDDITSVTYGGVDVPAVTNGRAEDPAGELGSCKAFFLGSASIPQGTQTVVVNRNNNTNELWAVAITITCSVAGKVGAVHEAGIVTIQGDGTFAEQSITDGSPGTNSVRYACTFSGLAAFPPTGASSTALHNFDTGNQTAAAVRETTAGQGARNVGFSSGTSDDRASVYLAIKEVAAATTFTISPTGSTTPVGALAKRADKALVGSTSPAGALARFVDRLLAGASSPSGALAKRADKALAGSTSPSGALATLKATLISLAGAISPAGAVAKRADKALVGSTSPAGALARFVDRLLAGASSPSGALAKRADKTLPGVSSPAGSLSKRADKALAGTSSPTGALTRRSDKALAGGTSPSGTLARMTSKLLTGSIAPVGALGRLVSKLVAGAISAVGGLTTSSGDVPDLPGTCEVVSENNDVELAAAPGASVEIVLAGPSLTLTDEHP
jgi:hypothetical protein